MSSLPLNVPLPLEASYQNYAWGDPEFIPRLFGFAPDGRPYAEAWLGAHERLPAKVLVDGRALALDVLIRDEGERLLGPSVLAKYGGLPYLFKVLAAKEPLSIQVHPSRAEAQAGFAREQAAGIAIDAANRNYRDANHKPELIVALTPFYALSGFRARAEIAQELARVPELSVLLPSLVDDPDSLKTLVQRYLTLDTERRDAALVAWIARLKSEPLQRFSPWVLDAHRVTERAGRPDPGLFFFLLLELFELSPGQGLFLSAGIPHAYLKGVGVEVMANSDNVLRCGLTTKHTDADELMRIVRFDAEPTRVLEAEPTHRAASVQRYLTPAPEFRLERLTLAPETTLDEQRSSGPEVLLVITAGARVQVATAHPRTSLELGAGAACLIPHGVSYRLVADAETQVMRVSIPND